MHRFALWRCNPVFLLLQPLNIGVATNIARLLNKGTIRPFSRTDLLLHGRARRVSCKFDSASGVLVTFAAKMARDKRSAANGQRNFGGTDMGSIVVSASRYRADHVLIDRSHLYNKLTVFSAWCFR